VTALPARALRRFGHICQKLTQAPGSPKLELSSFVLNLKAQLGLTRVRLDRVCDVVYAARGIERARFNKKASGALEHGQDGPPGRDQRQ
jgi:hypothetical protein